MSKGLGQKIAIRFSEKLVGDVTGLVPEPIVQGDYFIPQGTALASSHYGSNLPANAFNEQGYWETRVSGDQWIQIQLLEPTRIYGFRWQVGSSYRPGDFIFAGSSDGETWESLVIDKSPDVAGWYAFPTDTAEHYAYYRWTITSRYSSRLYIFRIDLLSVVGNNGAFIVTGEEYQYVNGPLITKQYKADSVERHPDHLDDKHLLVTFHPLSRFNNVEGALTVHYDPSKGSLRGRGGPVAGFTTVCLPNQLAPKPNPRVRETIGVSAEALVDFIKVTYRQAYSDEALSVSAGATVDFIYVGLINP